MVIELCSDTSSVVMSPRISFSHDLSKTDSVPIEQYIRSNSSSSVDFDFCVFRESFDQESSSADELFFDGKILPIEIKKKLGGPKKPDEPPTASLPQSVYDDFYHSSARRSKKNENPREKRMGVSESDEKQISNTAQELEEKQSSSKSWFKRSSSLNCGSGYARSLCPLPLLSRSNSTGSTPHVKRSSFMKENLSNKQQNLHKSASSSGHQKPPLKKSYTSYGNGVKVNPVLNVPTPTLFGLGSIFSTSKDKNKKK